MYNQRSRGQKSGVGRACPCAPPRVSSRMGLEKRGAPAQQPPRGNARVPISSAAPIDRPAAASPRGKTAPAKISPTMAAAPARSSRSTRRKAATRPARPAASAA